MMNNDPRHRAQHRQLWIDKVRDQFDHVGTIDEVEQTLKIETLARLSGVSGGMDIVRNVTPAELQFQLARYGLNRPLPVVALEAIEAAGYPQKELSIPHDWPTCGTKLWAALQWCTVDILRSAETRIMLLNDRTAKAVADSKNEGITAAELQHLPHNPCLIEFYRPIKIAEKIKGGVWLRAVGFESVGNAEAPAAVLAFYLDYWEKDQKTGTLWPATVGVWFGGLTMVTFDEAVYRCIGFESGSDIEAGISEACKHVARNLWDFVTSRSIKYEHVKRKHRKLSSAENRPQHVQGLRTKNDREVFLLYLTHSSEIREPAAGRPQPQQWGYRVEVPGKFHEYVYCAKCGALHRHDLLGAACRKCSETVGPRANVRVEKYWHHPYLVGPAEAPIKEVVRDVHRQKSSR